MTRWVAGTNAGTLANSAEFKAAYVAQATGLDPTGATSANTPLQAAIDAAAAAGGGTVRVPYGNYLLTSTLQMKSKVTLDFQGSWSVTGATSSVQPTYVGPTVKLANGSNCDMVQFGAAVTGARLRGVTLLGNRSQQTAGRGIRFVGTSSLPRSGNWVEQTYITQTFDDGVTVDANHYEARLREVLVIQCGGNGITIRGEDCYLDMILTGFNDGHGLVAEVAANALSLYALDTFDNAKAGLVLSGISSFRVHGVQTNANQQEGMILDTLGGQASIIGVIFGNNGQEFSTTGTRYSHLNLRHATAGMDRISFMGFHFTSSGVENYMVKDDQAVSKPLPFIGCSFTGTPAGGSAFNVPNSHRLVAPTGPGLADLAISSDPASIPLAAKGAPGQTAPLMALLQSDGTTLYSVSASGRTIIGQDFSARFNLKTTAATQVASATRGFTAQTADLEQWQTPTGTVVSRVGPTGRLESGYTTYPRSGTYLGPAVDLVTTGIPGSGFEYAVPVLIGASCTLSEIGIEVTTAGETGSTIRLGIRRDDGSGYPANAAPLLDAGTVAGDGATGYKSLTISLAVTSGLYWFTATPVFTTTGPTLRVMNGGLPQIAPTSGAAATNFGRNAYRQSGVTGALPATFNTTLDAQGAGPRVVAKVA